MTNTIIASHIPTLPIRLAKPSNFNYKGVGSGSSYKANFNLPLTELTPTAVTTIFPTPSITLVPEITKQLVFLLDIDVCSWITSLGINSGSPVNEDSSI